jgi:RNA polymerase sigma-70 factor (ECF subfamily)
VEDSELGQLYEKYGYLVHRRCLALMQNRAGADDALQDVFVRVQRYHRSQVGPAVLPWLYVIANNCCFDLMKRAGREEPTDEENLRRLEKRTVGAPSDADHRAVLGATLRRFDAKTREIGILHHLDGYTQEEVAVRTGYSRRTVGKKLKAFAEGLKSHWQSAGGFE